MIFGLQKMKIVVFGHSLGGSLATSITSQPVEAIILIDISEAVALQSLPAMSSFLHRKPAVFESEN